MIITAPASKSYAQRAIAAATIAQGRSELCGVGCSDDVVAAIGIARSLGADVEQIGDTIYISGGIKSATIVDVHEAGLATRLFTPIAALTGANFRVVGRASILNRPMGNVVDTLKLFGVDVKCDGYLPFDVSGMLSGGGEITIDGSQGSQLLTGLLMALPLTSSDTTINVSNLQSRPYIDITIDVMRSFGVEIENSDYQTFRVRGNQLYKAIRYVVEGDWSGASCMVVAGAIFGGVEIGNLNPTSLQADAAIVDAIAMAGSDLRAINFDATHCPDLFPSLVALASHCKGVSIIEGTHRLIHKESNRAAALKSEFEKLGISVDLDTPNIMKVTGGVIKSGAIINTHGDHRIAMATAVAALGVDISFDNMSVVDKSYPAFWSDYNKILRR